MYVCVKLLFQGVSSIIVFFYEVKALLYLTGTLLLRREAGNEVTFCCKCNFLLYTDATVIIDIVETYF